MGLANVARGYSLRETVARAKLVNWTDISDDDLSSRAWLYGKLLVTILAQKLIRIGCEISRSGRPVSPR
jgi:hypothetical protein